MKEWLKSNSPYFFGGILGIFSGILICSPIILSSDIKSPSTKRMERQIELLEHQNILLERQAIAAERIAAALEAKNGAGSKN